MSRPNVVTAARSVVTFANDGTAVSLGYLPANAKVIDAKVLVITAFDGSGTDLINIGVNGTANNIAASVDVSSTGEASRTLAAAAGAVQSSSDPTEITATYTDANSDATAGSAEVLVLYTFNE